MEQAEMHLALCTHTQNQSFKHAGKQLIVQDISNNQPQLLLCP